MPRTIVEHNKWWRNISIAEKSEALSGFCGIDKTKDANLIDSLIQ